MKEVSIKMRGGHIEKFVVKYEKLPLFSYVCRKLGHGEKDCEEGTVVATPKRMYYEKLRVSPWQVNKREEREEDKTEKGRARRLFIRKEKQASNEEREEARGRVE